MTPLEALQRAYAKPLDIPQRVPDEASWHVWYGYVRHLCSVCNCTWSGIEQGAANHREEWCERDICPCHSADWAAITYEGHR